MFLNLWLTRRKSAACLTLLIGVTLLLWKKHIDNENRVPLSESWKYLMDKGLMTQLTLIQECPWEPNATAVMEYRAELGECCNASYLLVGTKENTPLGSTIHLDGHRRKNITAYSELVNLLSERSPLAGFQYNKCALIGNGGILRHSSCGQEIDQADLIIRFNLPPMNYTEDVGTKTSLVTINPSILNNKFQSLQGPQKPFLDALQAYRDALFLIPSLSFSSHHVLGCRAVSIMKDSGLTHRAFFLHPHYLGAIRKYWEQKGLKEIRLSTGFLFISIALEFCEHITLYGFWPFSYDLTGEPLSHHYYDNILPNAGFHTMSEEFLHYLNMYAQGVLRIQLGKCQ
ncbi:alpha-2,8-sialyltransferase 8F-like isoform X1 [Python bivittatus]|uniref:Alpha-2,8-sialyltransferase 8F-like isoform X1 n=1 Tax=Python bivittatus TaxID=176946 RepID=A0A9F5ILW9_PYTBI|nr:alpha-2,8-sialyltransferase 8F-like isoform X1 [Python bivittatus]XP_025027306.1 alpha-2,8-sialyltransferase 8F-like isoform X2 [Python bivittatus]XP_025027307.1 alpha-2,8-sialyltransferase 8F-like isoform X1 [Python bivittatus]XP_025027308.1 alpha-2,8-sialyltransferase 8F-like isoform X1 [Python bivittatus]XP_025027309.1 alpha-2,8-sialyltransferase 8F-like isoform X1 [Python bivittatus]XP_025027311.1 alpha-2,8-sialyltransferase 8F-like isoform X1 [Python bivittatus]XP_025027312.1 alpha-2,